MQEQRLVEKQGEGEMEVEDDGDPNGRKRKYRMTSALTANDLEANAGRTPSFMVRAQSRFDILVTVSHIHISSNLGEQAETRGGCYHRGATEEGRTRQRPYRTDEHLLVPRR